MLCAKECPSCGTPWEHKETIYEYFLNRYTEEKREYPKAEAKETASMYGCTKENPLHFGLDVIGIEYQDGYDGVSEWKCKQCDVRFDRWTMKEIKEKYENNKS